MELAKQYEPSQAESKIYQKWERAGAFKVQPKAKGKPFVMVIPPPNVTGSLHMGHALNNTVQDILIRFYRMKGRPALWIPGVDHAGIATQNVVEKKLKQQGQTRQKLGREKFIQEVWAWKEQYGQKILEQLKKMGCSCDWDRTTFTLDEHYQKAVIAAFERYFQKGWIYQGERVISWCVRCGSSLSDLEVESEEEKGRLYFIKYGPIVVATTRPETMLGDSAVAVHPNDKRYQKLVGQKIILPLVGRELAVVADRGVDRKFGTGAVKVTPAHSLEDFEIGQRHQLAKIKVIDGRGRIITPGPYQGLDRLSAREKIIKDLKKADLLEKVTDYQVVLPYCSRCHTLVEHLLSKQWFVKMDQLKKPAIQALREGKIKFEPARFQKICLDWLEKSYDWCISRQLWWGHRLPVWHQTGSNFQFSISNSQIHVGEKPPKGEGWKQSEDVLDTWFSSALWSFAVLGWPEKNKDLAEFHPTSVLSTARDIIFLWVARMIFSSLELMAEIPFEKVYIHPTVLNIKGQRMSKSLGTGVDPLELIDKYGADAVRFGLMYQNTGIQDLRFNESALKASRNFSNKLWNISRFILINLSNPKLKTLNSKSNSKTQSDEKILKELDKITQAVSSDIENFRFGQAAHALYDFVWHSLADDYLEVSKLQLKDVKLQKNTQQILLYVLTETLRLLHPFMPFITEEIWGELNRQKLVKEKLLIKASYAGK